MIKSKCRFIDLSPADLFQAEMIAAPLWIFVDWRILFTAADLEKNRKPMIDEAWRTVAAKVIPILQGYIVFDQVPFRQL